MLKKVFSITSFLSLVLWLMAMNAAAQSDACSPTKSSPQTSTGEHP